MPIRDAVGLARFLVETTIGFVKFSIARPKMSAARSRFARVGIVADRGMVSAETLARSIVAVPAADQPVAYLNSGSSILSPSLVPPYSITLPTVNFSVS
jgi:hypothetical protein